MCEDPEYFRKEISGWHGHQGDFCGLTNFKDITKSLRNVKVVHNCEREYRT